MLTGPTAEMCARQVVAALLAWATGFAGVMLGCFAV